MKKIKIKKPISTVGYGDSTVRFFLMSKAKKRACPYGLPYVYPSKLDYIWELIILETIFLKGKK